jgi:hypothetical protein
MNTRRILESLYRKIDRLEKEVSNLQESCTHPNVKKTWGGNTGNYDPSADKTWILHECPDCDKVWKEFQND